MKNCSNNCNPPSRAHAHGHAHGHGHALQQRQQVHVQRRRMFKTVCIFQLLGTLVCSGFLTTLWLMVRLEASYNTNVVMNNAGGQRGRGRGQGRGRIISNEMRLYADEQSPQEMQMYQLEDILIQQHPVGNQRSQPPHQKEQIMHNRIISPRSNESASLLFPPLPPSLNYLGVLIDAGRHYFPLRWLYQQLRHLHILGYNYIHFRLTDDQNFVLNLTIPDNGGANDNNNAGTTSLAFVARREQERDGLRRPDDGSNSNSNSNNVGSGSVYYQPHELSEFVKFAKDNYNITVIPEINVPGHAGAWGANAAFPDLVISCPEFACSKGYGVPLNVSHPELPRILKYVLTQVVEIFDYPPFLHLGGDELHMSRPCLEEAGIADPTSWLEKTVPFFEYNILRPIVEELGYGPHQIMRWETRKKQPQPKSKTKTKRRFGGITHYWESTPLPQKNNGNGDSSYDPYVVSTGLYLDVLWSNRVYGYGDFQAAQQLSDLRSNPPFAIVAGAFELSTEFWEDRNVLGRLLAIRMGISSSSETTMVEQRSRALQRDTDQKREQEVGHIESSIVNIDIVPRTQQEFHAQYIAKCNAVFPFSKYEFMCQKAGWPLLEDRRYQAKWLWVWKEWKDGLCEGLTYPEQNIRIKPSTVYAELQRKTNYYYWDNVLSSSLSSSSSTQPLHQNVVTAYKSPTSNIPNVGIVVDLVQDPISQQDFLNLLQSIQPLGINLVQLRIADDFGQVVEYESIPNVGYHPTSSQRNKTDEKSAFTIYNRHHLEQMVEWAHHVGIQLMPEINLATNGGGWFKTGMLMNCPQIMCDKGRGIAFDVIDKIESVMPIVLAAIRELRDIFSLSSSNQLLHLGSDQREMAVEGCFAEAGHATSEAHAALRHFERTLFAALSLMGIEQNHIIRWHNEEKVEYPDRAGKITQYTDIDDLVNGSGNDSAPTSFFGTVLLTDEMTPWDVYQATRRWTIKPSTPKGIVAKAINGQTPRLDHLVAFTMGLRRTPNKNEVLPSTTKDDFQREFETLCTKSQCAADNNEPFGRAANIPSPPTVASLMDSCVERTTNITLKKSRASLLSRGEQA